MLGLKIKKGTVAVAVKFYGDKKYRYKQILTKKDNVFIREDIILDPIGKLTDTSKENGGPLVLSFLFGNEPVYGFRKLNFDTGERSNWALIVRSRDVETG
jgi:hypothetical protein